MQDNGAEQASEQLGRPNLGAAAPEKQANGPEKAQNGHQPLQVRTQMATAADIEEGGSEFSLSPLRWRLLIGVCVFGYCNGFANEHSVILDIYVGSLGMDLADYVGLYQIFFFVPMVASFVAAGMIDRFGLKPVIYLTLLMAAARNGARMLLFSPHLSAWAHLRLLYWFVQRGLTQMNYAFYNCIPLKIAESWFSETERPTALAFLMTVPIMGAASGGFVLPRLVPDMDSCVWIVRVNFVALIVSFCALALGVRRSAPVEGAPSARGQIHLDRKLASKQSSKAAAGTSSAGQRVGLFLAEFTRVIRTRNLVVQLFAVITFDQLTLTIIFAIQDIFAGAGLSSVFTGQFLATLTLSATIVQVLASRRLKPSKKENSDPYKTRLCKTFLLIEMVLFVLFGMSLVLHELPCLSRHTDWLSQNQWILVSISSFLLMLVKNCAAPYLNEQTAVLICGLVSESNVGAWQSAIGSLLFNSYAFIFVHLRQRSATTTTTTTTSDVSAAGDDTTSHHGRPLYLRSVLFICVVAVVATVTYVIKFDTSGAGGNRRPQIGQRKHREQPGGGGGDGDVQPIELVSNDGNHHREDSNAPPGWEVIEIETTRL